MLEIIYRTFIYDSNEALSIKRPTIVRTGENL